MANESIATLSSSSEPTFTFILAIATVILAFATIFLAYFTFMLYNETKKMRVLQTQPEISIYTAANSHVAQFINLIIKNTGPGTAYDVKFDVTPDFYCGPKQLNKLLKDTALIKEGIQIMSPNQEFKFVLFHFLDYINSEIPSLVICVSYRNIDGTTYNKTYNFDLSVYKGLIPEIENNLHEISETLKSIANEMGNLKHK